MTLRRTESDTGRLRAALACGVLAVLLLAAVAPDAARADESPSGTPSRSGGSESGSPSSGPPEMVTPTALPPGSEALTPITGGHDGDSAPEIRTGRYVDTAPPMDTARGYKLVRTMPGSTVFFGVTVLDPRHAHARLQALLLAPDGKGSSITCGRTTFTAKTKAELMPLSSQGGYTWRRDACADTDYFYVVVNNIKEELGREDTPAMPEGTPYELDVREEPAIANLGQVQRDYDTTWGNDQAVEPEVTAQPGVSMSEAVPLPLGRTASVALPVGRVSYFWAPVALDQRLQVLVDVPDASALAGAGMEVRILSPVGGLVDSDDSISTGQPAPRSVTLGAGRQLLSAAMNALTPGNRPTTADDQLGDFYQDVSVGSSPGNYLVAVWVQELSGVPLDSLPIRIRARVNDRYHYPGEDWVPVKYASPYPTDAFAAPSGPEPVDYQPPAPISESEAPSRSALDWVLIGFLAVGSVLCAVLALRIVRRAAG